jgi:hypothetical protein
MIGESMGRVKPLAKQLKTEGFDVKTYNPKKWRSTRIFTERKDMERNRSWIRYWAKEKSAQIVDVGYDVLRKKKSDFYEMERRSLKRWGIRHILY